MSSIAEAVETEGPDLDRVGAAVDALRSAIAEGWEGSAVGTAVGAAEGRFE